MNHAIKNVTQPTQTTQPTITTQLSQNTQPSQTTPARPRKNMRPRKNLQTRKNLRPRRGLRPKKLSCPAECGKEFSGKDPKLGVLRHLRLYSMQWKRSQVGGARQVLTKDLNDIEKHWKEHEKSTTHIHELKNNTDKYHSG